MATKSLIKNRQPKVSVCMLAYNNSEYVEAAISSVFEQIADFPIELVIGEDSSTDNVVEKIKKFSSTTGVDIRVRYNKSNVGLIKNLDITLSECRGEYIAYLDNDDYWTDKYKLQKQVDFLDKNANYSICYHPVLLLRDGNIVQDVALEKSPDISNILDLANGNFIRSCSIMYRASAFNGFPESYYNSPVNDYFLFMLVARNGLIKRLDDAMAVYRIHSNSDWSSNPNQSFKILDYLECMIDFFDAEVRDVLIKRHQRIALSLLLERVDKCDFNALLQRSLMYDDNIFCEKLRDLIYLERKTKKTLFSRILKFIN